MAMPTATPAVTPSAHVVGSAFVDQYYHILHASPDLVHRFYQDTSVLTRPDINGAMKSVTTMQDINDMILSLDYKNYKAEIKSADAQESFNGGLMVLVIGCLTGKDHLQQKFAQSFFLAPQVKGYFVLNDVFRFVDENESLALQTTSAADNVAVESVVPSNSPSQPENEEGSVAVEVVAESAADLSQNEDRPITETATFGAQEDAPKKSYASIVKVFRGDRRPTAVYVPANKMGQMSVASEDTMDWPDKNENVLLNIMYERVKHDINAAPTFEPSDWKDIDEELYLETGVRYGSDKVKGKYNRLRIKQRLFSDLLEHTGVTYDLSSNTVFTAEDVWQLFYKKNKMYKSFRKHGCKNYQLLTQVFGKSTATGQLHHASTQLPPTSDEERQVEEDFLSKSTHHISESEIESSKGKRTAEEFIPSCIHVKKEGKLEKLDSCLQMWATFLEARAQKDLAKAESYKEKSSMKATSPISDPYTVDNCMDVLEMMEGVSDDAYNKAVTKFKDPYWRNVFLKMSDSRRKAWVANLE